MFDNVRTGDKVCFNMVVHNPSGGYAQQADVQPRWYLLESGNPNLTVHSDQFTTNTLMSGVYYGNLLAISQSGLEDGKYYEVYGSAEIDGLVDFAFIKGFRVDSMFNSNLMQVHSGDFDWYHFHMSGEALNSGIRQGLIDHSYYITSSVYYPLTVDWHERVGSFGSGLHEQLRHLYYADIKLTKDAANTRDEYSVSWFRDGLVLTSGAVSVPRISAYDNITGTVLFQNQELSSTATNDGGSHYIENTTLAVSGQPYLVRVSGIIDNSMRQWKKIVGIDSL